jgi:hypothetical protein
VALASGVALVTAPKIVVSDLITKERLKIRYCALVVR